MKTVASEFDYTASGGVKKMKLGNGPWETANVDHLGQLTQVGLGTTATNKDLFKIDYEYGELSTDGTSVDTAKNRGMIARTTTTIPTTSFVQTFKYDSINRLTEAVEKTGSTQNWKQTFGYDHFGNRTSFYQIVGSTELPTNSITKPTIDPASNRFTTGQGYVYDLSGNLIADAEGRSFTFNGDDKQTEVRDTATNAVIGQYFYDGSGARVKKVTNTETTVFVYDAGGTLAAEYSTEIASVEDAKTSYLTTDHLGSPRVITDAEGEVIARRDFMPFGEELYAGVGGRTTNLKYSYLGSDNVRQRFTGYEKDNETELDFAQARMYHNKHGRFTAPDPLLASASAFNPQTFNRYTYTGNDPINYTDPSGLKHCRRGDGGVYWTENGAACDSGDTLIDNRVQQCKDLSCNTDDGPIGQGGFAFFNGATGRIERITDPTPDQAAQIAEATGASVQAESETVVGSDSASIATHVSSAGETIADNTGLLIVLDAAGVDREPVVHTIPGRIVGHGLSLTLSISEMLVGGGLIAAGTGGNLVGFGFDLTGVGTAVGVPINVVSTGAIVTGAAIATHGSFTAVNTLVNVNSQGSGGSRSGTSNNSPQGPSSSIKDSTIGNSTPNIDTNATPLAAAKALKGNGFKPKRSLDKKALTFTKGGVRYSLRMSSKSTGGPTLHRQDGQKITKKIRLNK